MQTESFQQQVLIIKKEKNMKSYVLHFMFCERVETCLQSLEHMYVHYYKNVCYVDVYFMNNTNYGHCSTGFLFKQNHKQYVLQYSGSQIIIANSLVCSTIHFKLEWLDFFQCRNYVENLNLVNKCRILLRFSTSFRHRFCTSKNPFSQGY